MASRRGVLDASVLYPEPVRSLLLWIATQEGFDPCWTERILEETRRNLIGDRAMSPAQWEGLRVAMQGTFPDALIEQANADAIEQEMPNDPKDRHVLAAAVAAGVDLVVTNNVKHFRQADIESVGVRAITADQFLGDLLDTAPNVVLRALEKHAASMRNPRQWSVGELLGRLTGLGHGDALAPRFAKAAATKLDIEMTTPPERHGL
jgi:predicted nucleic acid-binding protein